MTQIEQVVKQIQSEFRIDGEGKVSVSIRGAARLTDIDATGLSRSLASGVDQKVRPLAVFLLGQGIEAVDLVSWADLGIPDTALALILEYYAYETQPRYRSQQAKLCCRAFNSIGIRTWIKDCLKWESQQKTRAELPQATPEERLAMATNALNKLGIELDNPRHTQGLRDWAFNLLGIANNQPALSGDRWTGAAERAEELGFGRIGSDHSGRVKLGRWVSKHDLERRREKRYCNGEDREIWCYRVCDDLDEPITKFFS